MKQGLYQPTAQAREDRGTRQVSQRGDCEVLADGAGHQGWQLEGPAFAERVPVLFIIIPIVILMIINIFYHHYQL